MFVIKRDTLPCDTLGKQGQRSQLHQQTQEFIVKGTSRTYIYIDLQFASVCSIRRLKDEEAKDVFLHRDGQILGSQPIIFIFQILQLA